MDHHALACSLVALAALCVGCDVDGAAVPEQALDAGADAPSWLGDAGIVRRAPVARPLRTLCGLASNPGDLPVGTDPASAALRAGYFDAARDLGGVMIRRDFRWQDIEPEKDAWAFEPYDALVDAAEQRGVPLLAALLFGTTWAHEGARDEYYPPDHPVDFVRFASAVAGRYAGRLAGYEIWNEPNVGFRFWKTALSGDPAGYADLLAAAAPAVRAADPSGPVVLGGTAFTPQFIDGAIDWLGAAYAAKPDLAASFDVAGVHTYMTYPPKAPPEIGLELDPPLEDKIGMHAWLLDQHASDAPIWITELGWPVTLDVDGDAQARYLVRATILAARAGAAGIFWYTLRDFADHDPGAFPPEGSFGLMEHNPDPAAQADVAKPAYLALRALLSTIGDRWPSADASVLADADPDVRVVQFAGDERGSVLAAWTVTKSEVAIAAPADATVLDQDGAVRAHVAQGELVALSPDVTYLRYDAR